MPRQSPNWILEKREQDSPRVDHYCCKKSVPGNSQHESEVIVVRNGNCMM
jgi:hypothetical protein